MADPLGKGDGLERLLKAVLNADWDKAVKLIDEPFVGLRAMREEESDRFFGRKAEVAELAEKLRKHRIVAIVADSGTGKSSLAQAGFATAFRGGALIDPMREGAREKIWQVVTMRPGADPAAGLRQGVTEAAERLGRSLDTRASLRKQVSVYDASETAYALQFGSPSAKTSTLLIVDQFEELFTATPNALQAPFIRLLLGVADSDKDVRIVLTVRADYFNLLSGVKDGAGKPVTGADGKTPFERLNANSGDAILRLKRISEEGLRDAVCEPLRRAGELDESALQALTKAVKRDISDQPSDLPLLQVALRAAWQERQGPTGRCWTVTSPSAACEAHWRTKPRQSVRKSSPRTSERASNPFLCGSCVSATRAAPRGARPRSTSSTRRVAISCSGSARTNTGGSWRSARQPRKSPTKRSSPSGRGYKAASKRTSSMSVGSTG